MACHRRRLVTIKRTTLRLIAETSASIGEGGLQDLPIETLHLILAYLAQGNKDQLGVTTEQKDNFFSAVRKGKYMY